MKIHHELGQRAGRGKLALAIGVFDGVHLGHRALLDTLRTYVGPDVHLGVLSFRNHPLRHLRPHEAPPLVVSLEERVNRLADAGVEELYLTAFDERMANLEATYFLEQILVQELQVVAVAVGISFRYGARRRGDVALAHEVLSRSGVAFHAVEHILDSGERVSSTRIRAALAIGQLAEVDRLLGHPYDVSGVVTLGMGRGHDLGFPTANLAIGEDRALPPDGVYSAAVRYDGRDFLGLVSIGTNPTFDGSRRTVEVWIRDFQQTIYGETIRVDNLRFIRGQQRFASVAELMEQMRADATVLDGLLQD